MQLYIVMRKEKEKQKPTLVCEDRQKREKKRDVLLSWKWGTMNMQCLRECWRKIQEFPLFCLCKHGRQL